MSAEAVAELALKIVLSPNAQKRIVQKRVPKKWAATESVRMAQEYLAEEDTEGLDDYFVARAGLCLDVGVNDSAKQILDRIRPDVARIDADSEAYETLIDELTAEIGFAIDPDSRPEPEPEADPAPPAPTPTPAPEAPLSNLDNQALRAVPVSHFVEVHAPALAAIGEAGLATVGDVLNYVDAGQKLSDISGCGEKSGADLIAAIKAIASEEAIKESPALQG